MADPTLDDARWMREALAVARAGLDAGELPIGAVVVRGEEVLAAEHTREASEKRLLVHADLLALEAADRLRPSSRRDCRLYVTLEPCLMCLGAAMSFFIGGVCYGLEAPGDGAAALVRGWQRDEAAFPAYRIPRITGGVLRSEQIALMREYVARARAGALRDWAGSLPGVADPD